MDQESREQRLREVEAQIGALRKKQPSRPDRSGFVPLPRAHVPVVRAVGEFILHPVAGAFIGYVIDTPFGSFPRATLIMMGTATLVGAYRVYMILNGRGDE